jgi:hypothetical protein
MKKMRAPLFVIMIFLFFVNNSFCQSQVPYHWRHNRTLHIRAGKDTTIVIEFLIISGEIENYNFKFAEDNNFVFKLEPGYNKSFQFLKNVKFILISGESLSIEQYATKFDAQSNLYASGYYYVNK